MAGRLLAFPVRGAFRVHRNPTVLERRFEPSHRFDDPDGEYGVWYFATTLRGALVEVLDHWRPDPSVETKLSAISGVDDDDIIAFGGGDRAGAVPLRFLNDQLVTKATLEPNPGRAFLNVMDEDYLAETTLHPSVREALADGGREAFGSPPTLNFGNIQAAHPAARRLTQAVSRVVYEDGRKPAGIRYISRHTDNEECWAVFVGGDRTTEVEFRPPERLDATTVPHRRAVQDAAKLLRVLLPDVWASPL